MLFRSATVSGNGASPSANSPTAAPGDASQAGQTVSGGASSALGTATAASPQGPASNGSPQNGSSQVFGGAGIVGVASVSKKQTIREFNKKNRYNQWQFIYDPTTDRGGLLMTPNQPPLQGATQVAPLHGPVGTNPVDQNNMPPTSLPPPNQP